MKRLALFICTLLCANVLIAQTRFWVGDLRYEVTSINPQQVEVHDYSSYPSSVTIPPLVSYNNTTYSVTSIGESAFAYCSSLISVTIPNSVTSIGEGAFGGCRSLTSVTIPNSVTSIGESAFAYCSSLASITIPNSVTSIGYNVFRDCSSLTSITIPNSVTTIGPWAFAYCSSLTSITIPNSVTSIGNYAFRDCSSLTSITIPNSITTIEGGVFYNCSSLTSVTIPNSITTIEGGVFYNCSSLTSVTIPNSVTSIGTSAFYGCRSLTSITIPNSVTAVGGGVFYGCNNLTSVTLSNNITSLPSYYNSGNYYGFFEDCSSLTSITIPNSVTSIGEYAFYGCSSLTSVTCLATIPPSIGNYAFHYPNTLTLSIPCVSLDAYSSPTSLWNMFFSDRISGIEYNVEVSVNNDDFGSVAIENNCSTATLTANANDCYQFVGWNDGNTENPRIVSLTSDTSLTAIFENLNTELIVNICQGQAYTENGFNVSEAGVYTQNLQTINGCDSIVTLTLNVNPIYNTELTATICEGQVYNENGFYVSEAGVYTQNLPTVNGCDSIVTLTLNVNPIYNTELTATICQGQTYTENGFNVSEAGVYTQTLQALNGCDSIVTLTLSVNPILNTNLSAFICEGETYTENGFNVSEAGTYTQSLQSVSGCDSIVTLTLNVNPIYNTELTATICQGQTYTENGFNVSEAGVYTQNLQTINGCDSIVTLTLNVLPSYNTNLTATICEGSELNISGFNVSEAGVYTQTYTAVNGCDSIVTLTVTELPTIHTDLTLTICEGTSLNFSGFNVSEAGVYTQNLTAVNGCDSIVTLTVSVNPVFDTTINATINSGETYAEFGFNESEAGTYVQNLQTENGCDSTITLNLTVNSSLYDVAELTEITFYPNPTSGKVTFSKAIEKIEVIDNIGKVVMRFFETEQIDIETLPSGAYYLRLTIEDKTTTRKVIKE